MANPIDISGYFFNQGILGVIILVEAGVIGWQEKQKSNKDKDIKELQTQLNTLADKRTEDVRIIQEKAFNTLEVVRATDVERTDKLKTLIDQILTIVSNMQNMYNLRGRK